MKKGWICKRCNEYGFEENQYETENCNAVPEALEDQIWWDGDETISAEEIAREEWEGRPDFISCRSLDHDIAVVGLNFDGYETQYYRYDLLDLDEYYRECEGIQQ